MRCCRVTVLAWYTVIFFGRHVSRSCSESSYDVRIYTSHVHCVSEPSKGDSIHTSSDLSRVQTLSSEVQVIQPRSRCRDRDDCLGEETVSWFKLRALSKAQALQAAKLILVFAISEVPKSRTIRATRRMMSITSLARGDSARTARDEECLDAAREMCRATALSLIEHAAYFTL